MSVGHPVALVVDDEEDMLNVVSLVLAREGWDVDTAHDGHEALERVDARRPNLIVLDMRMPGLDGWGFCVALAAQSGERPPILVMSAAPDVANSAAQVGAKGWLAKPFDLEVLVAAARPFMHVEPPVASGPIPR